MIVAGQSSPAVAAINYTPGQPITVSVYLTQTSGPTNYLASENGLGQGAVLISFAADGPVSVADVSDITPNTSAAASAANPTSFNDVGLSNSSRAVTSTSARLLATTDYSYGVLPDVSGRIRLGDVTFQTSGAGVSGNVTFDGIPGNFIDNLTLSGTDLDSAVTPVQFNFSPVPEPATVLAVGALGLAVAGVRRRWRATRAAAPAIGDRR